MEYTTEDGTIVVRLDPGDQVLESLETIREEADVSGGFFMGIGAVDVATLGHYDAEAQEYTEKTFEGEFEVTAFGGNIGPDKIHAHIQLGKPDFSTIGGHCAGARVSGTFEIVIYRTDVTLTHRPDETTGLDVFDI